MKNFILEFILAILIGMGIIYLFRLTSLSQFNQGWFSATVSIFIWRLLE